MVLQEKKIPSTQQLRNKYAKCTQNGGGLHFYFVGIFWVFFGFFGFRVPEANLCTTLTPKVQKSPESGKKQKKSMFCGGENSKFFAGMATA